MFTLEGHVPFLRSLLHDVRIHYDNKRIKVMTYDNRLVAPYSYSDTLRVLSCCVLYVCNLPVKGPYGGGVCGKQTNVTTAYTYRICDKKMKHGSSNIQ